tara:strand:- start:412 stop:714 length:303 start_codon:yes stop_codon:yes gene_type:complete
LAKKYWNKYYANHHNLEEPISFTKSIIKLVPENCKMMELGWGNGRDSFYFARMGHSLWACVQYDVIINTLPTLKNNSPHFYINYIRDIKTIPDMKFDRVY